MNIGTVPKAIKYRKRPVEIHALQWLPHNHFWADATQMLEEFWQMSPLSKDDDTTSPFLLEEGFQYDGGLLLIIETLEGDMAVSPGDFIIMGVNGEFYPCKPDIFAKTYDIVDDAS